MSSAPGTAGLLLDVVLAATVLGVVGAAGAAAARRVWRPSPSLSIPFGLLAVGSAGLVSFFAFLVGPGVGITVARALATAAAAVAAWSAWTHRRLIGRSWRSLGAPVLLVTGVLLCVVSLFALWRHDLSWFELARIRFSHQLPSDNEIPSYVAVRLLEGGDPRTAPGGDWHSSDRPPLQTGLLLLVRATVGMFARGTTDLDFATGLVAQVSWLVAGLALLRAMGVAARTSVLALVFAAASGTVLVNTVFTWPKLLSAAFVLAALAVLVDVRRNRRPTAGVAAAGALVAFGLLSHGAAVFALVLVAWGLFRVRRSVPLRALAVGGLVLLVTYLPWLLYQRFYDPPGDRLLKWHLAGVTEPTARSFGETLVQAYARTPLGTLVQYKLSNITLPFSRLPLAGIGTLTADPADRRMAEFFILLPALGLGTLALCYLMARALRSLRRPRPDDGFLRAASGWLVAVAVGQLAWSLALFLPDSAFVHQGSHVPVLLLLLLPFVELARRRPAPAAALLGVQVGLLLLTYAPGPAAGGPMSSSALCIGLVGAAVTAAAVVVAAPGAPDRAAVPGEDTQPIPRRNDLPPGRSPGRTREGAVHPG